MILKNKKAIITGAARGIGLEISKKLVKNGCQVVILDKVEKLEFLDALINDFPQIDYYQCDIANQESRSEVLEILYKKYLNFDILINNARFKSKYSLDEPLTEWMQSINVNLTSPFFLSQEFIKRAENGGSIINICSVASVLATSESPSYHAAKGGLLALTKYLAVQGGKKQVRVNALLPGLIVQNDHLKRFNSSENALYQDMCKQYQPMGEVGKESDVANLAVFLSSDLSKYISGSSINIDGAATVQDQFSLITKFKP